MQTYDTAEYARTRLVETIIRYKGLPVMVHDCQTSGKDILVFYTFISGDDDGIHQANLDEFNLDPVPLGYVNHKNYAHYLTRAPMRRDWRQGLRMMNMFDPDGANPRQLGWKAVAETIVGKFPSFSNTIGRLQSNPERSSKIAFNRDFSLDNKGVIEYKGMFKIGEVGLDNRFVTIADKFSWTREAFEEAMEGKAA